MGDVAELAEWIENARHGIALTGAGVSTESGIPDFRSDAGLWAETDPQLVASIDGFLEDPVRFYRFWRDKFAGLAEAKPNAAHRLLAGLESRGRMHAVITQNIDGLHRRAGSHRVLEIHGTFRKAQCLECAYSEPIESVFARFDAGAHQAPTCVQCGAAKLKPAVVLFGESLPSLFAQAEAEVEQADLLLVMGTALEVHPVAGLVPRAKRSGCRVAIVNRDATALDDEADLVVRGELGQLSKELMNMLSVA